MQQALDSKSIAVGALPDPVASVSLLNMPIDGYDFNQGEYDPIKNGD
ncbi:MAG: hypothetical protein Q9N32_07340 [Gammaproteobacteria bacterium]|nr:hypothetical protein [Gammaproteobacteria bacterium]